MDKTGESVSYNDEQDAEDRPESYRPVVHERLARLEAENEALQSQLGRIEEKIDGLGDSIDSNADQIDEHRLVYRFVHVAGVVLLTLNSGVAIYIVTNIL